MVRWVTPRSSAISSSVAPLRQSSSARAAYSGLKADGRPSPGRGARLRGLEPMSSLNETGTLASRRHRWMSAARDVDLAVEGFSRRHILCPAHGNASGLAAPLARSLETSDSVEFMRFWIVVNRDGGKPTIAGRSGEASGRAFTTVVALAFGFVGRPRRRGAPAGGGIELAMTAAPCSSSAKRRRCASAGRADVPSTGSRQPEPPSHILPHLAQTNRIIRPA